MINNRLIDKAQYEEELNERWSWITEDIADKEARLNTQIVLENSYKKMVGEGSVPKNWLQDNILSEEVIEEAPQTSAAVGDYVIPKVMFPIIRRVMPELIANKLVSVQPLSAPTGVIYYITYKYSNDKSNVKAGDEFSANPFQTDPAYSTYYTSEKLGPLTVKVTDAIDTTINGDEVAKIATFLGDDATIASTYKRIEVFNKRTHKAILAKNASGSGTVTFSSDDGGTALATFDGTELVVKAAALTAIGTEADDEITAFLVYNQEGTKHIPEMEFDIDHMDVSTTERKLKVRWTKEAEQDMQAYHKINVEEELVKVAAVQTNYEIDREVINAIDDIVIDKLVGEFDWSDTTGQNVAGNYLDLHRALAQKMYQYCTKIAQYNKIAPADWAVTNPQVAAVLQMLPDWKNGEINSNKSTFYNAGTLGSGAISVYVDPNRMAYGTDGESVDITLGFKSKDSTYGAGMVYSPYANWMSATVVNPENFNNVRGTFSRYAITATPRAEYNYGRVTVNNLAV